LNQIVELNESSFSETKIGELSPLDAYPSGLHTIAATADYCVIDGKRLVWTPLGWLYWIRSKARSRRLATDGISSA
jgi:hypothetical protein